MKRTAIIFIVILCTLTLVSSLALAYWSFGGRSHGMPEQRRMWSEKSHDGIFFHKARMILSHAAELGLSDDQISKIKALEYDFKKNLIKEKADIQLLGLDIRQALRKDEVDVKTVNSLIDQKYVLKAQEAKQIVQACLDLKKILSKEQAKELKELRPWNTMGRMHRRGEMRKGKESQASQEEGE